MSGLVIRPVTLADIPALLTVESQSFASDRISPRQMRYLLARGKAVTLVATQNELVFGYAMALTPEPPRPARIYSLAVCSAQRGKHAGTDLLVQLIDLLRRRDYSRIRLEVRALDTRVQRLYQNLGFTTITRLPGYYEDGAEGLRMELYLSPTQRKRLTQ